MRKFLVLILGIVLMVLGGIMFNKGIVCVEEINYVIVGLFV